MVSYDMKFYFAPYIKLVDSELFNYAVSTVEVFFSIEWDASVIISDELSRIRENIMVICFKLRPKWEIQDTC